MIRWGLAISVLLVTPRVEAAVFEVSEGGTMTQLDLPATVARPGPRPRMVRPSPSASAVRFRPAVDLAARRYEVSPALIDAVARVESRYDPRAVSRAKAVGVMQLMPGTARAMGVEPTDPAANIRGGTAYLRVLLNRFDGDIVRTVAAYNAGPAAVVRAGGIPRFPETVAYVAAVMDQLAAAAE